MSNLSFSERMARRMPGPQKPPVTNGSGPAQGRTSKVDALLFAAKAVAQEAGQADTLKEVLDAKKELEVRLRQSQLEAEEARKTFLSANENISRERKELQLSREHWVKEISHLQTEFEEKKANFQEDVQERTRHQAIAAELRKKLKQAEQDVQEQDRSLNHMIKDLEATRKRLGNAETELEFEKAKVKSSMAEKDKLARDLLQHQENIGRDYFTTTEVNIEKWTKPLARIEQDWRDLAAKFFSDLEINEDTLNGHVNSMSVKVDHIPISVDSGPDAARIRQAVAQAVCSGALSHFVFKPVYGLDDTSLEAAETLLEYFDDMGSDDSREMLLYRLHMSTRSEDPRSTLVRDAKARIAKDLSRLLKPADVDEFERQTEDLMSKAVQFWSSNMQKARAVVHIEPAMSLDPRFGPRESTDPDEKSVTLFPGIMVGETVLHEGTALWSDQKTIAAERERLGRPPLGGPPRRKLSRAQGSIRRT